MSLGWLVPHWVLLGMFIECGANCSATKYGFVTTMFHETLLLNFETKRRPSTCTQKYNRYHRVKRKYARFPLPDEAPDELHVVRMQQQIGQLGEVFQLHVKRQETHAQRLALLWRQQFTKRTFEFGVNSLLKHCESINGDMTLYLVIEVDSVGVLTAAVF